MGWQFLPKKDLLAFLIQKAIFNEPFPFALLGGDLNGNDNNALAEGAEGEENGTHQQQPSIGFAAGLMMKALKHSHS